MVEKKTMNLGRDFFLYGLGFLLLMEWLLPLPSITDTGYIRVFVIFTSLFFLITFLQLPLAVSMVVKLGLSIYGIYLIFYESPFFALDWLLLFVAEMGVNLGFIVGGNFYELTDMFRSFLFFVLLSIMSYLLFYWIVYMRRALFFLVLTIIYITVLDTFTAYDASMAIVRTFVVGFVLLGLVTIYRKMEREGVRVGSRYLPLRLGLMLVAVIGISSILGFAFPKLDPQWDDPMPFMRAAVGLDPYSDSVEVVQRIGYGDSDGQLGGGFIDDETTVFYVTAPEAQYWRGETKDFYTGRGWETTTPEQVQPQAPLRTATENLVSVEQRRAEVQFEDGQARYEHLFYPGQLDSSETAGIVVDAYTEKATTYSGSSPTVLTRYEIDYYYPTYYIDQLQQSSEVDPQNIQDYYLQLPDSVPQRVYELAEGIVSEYENRYDQAKAIENYFQRSGFRYETTDVPIPEDGQDYVDQFLFETQAGYCDNFSTSMVVLLRSVGIPARWAKGFTAGTLVDSTNEQNVYEIRNSNAHSWVEVYFPEVGWVPFEPTRGFTNEFDFTESPVDNQQNTEIEQTDREEPLETVENEEQEVEDAFAELEEASTEEVAISPENGAGGLPFPLWWLALPLLILCMALFAGNKKLVGLALIGYFRVTRKEDAFVHAYKRLLWYLNYIGLGKKQGETLREYAVRIDQEWSTETMTTLTFEYERLLYSSDVPANCWEHVKGDWLQLMRKISS